MLAVAGPGWGAPQAERTLFPPGQAAGTWFPAVGIWFLLLWVGFGGWSLFPYVAQRAPSNGNCVLDFPGL